MARNKTRLAKLKAAARHQEHQSQVQATSPESKLIVPVASLSSTSSNSATRSRVSLEQIFGYPLKLIYGDLLKTVVVVSILLASISGLAVIMR